jgi:hypothetical protein
MRNFRATSLVSAPKPKRPAMTPLFGSFRQSRTRSKPIARYMVSRVMRSTSFSEKSSTSELLMSWIPAARMSWAASGTP